jgi:hypothetical protein
MKTFQGYTKKTRVVKIFALSGKGSKVQGMIIHQ